MMPFIFHFIFTLSDTFYIFINIIESCSYGGGFEFECAALHKFPVCSEGAPLYHHLSQLVYVAVHIASHIASQYYFTIQAVSQIIDGYR